MQLIKNINIYKSKSGNDSSSQKWTNFYFSEQEEHIITIRRPALIQKQSYLQSRHYKHKIRSASKIKRKRSYRIISIITTSINYKQLTVSFTAWSVSITALFKFTISLYISFIFVVCWIGIWPQILFLANTLTPVSSSVKICEVKL